MCACRHQREDHDWWGAGECRECECETFQAVAISQRDDVVGEVAIRTMEMRYARALLFGGQQLEAMIAWIALARGWMRPMPEAPQ